MHNNNFLRKNLTLVQTKEIRKYYFVFTNHTQNYPGILHDYRVILDNKLFKRRLLTLTLGQEGVFDARLRYFSRGGSPTITCSLKD